MAISPNHEKLPTLLSVNSAHTRILQNRINDTKFFQTHDLRTLASSSRASYRSHRRRAEPFEPMDERWLSSTNSAYRNER